MDKSAFEDDEHILERYWLILLRRWPIVATVFILMLIGGVSYAKTRPPLPFPHVTTIEIGRFADGMPLEDMKVVENKVKEAYMPIVLQEHANKNEYDQKRYSIEVEAKEHSNTLLLKSYGSENNTEILLTFEQKIADLLIEDHKQKTELIKRDLEQQEFKAKLVLEGLEEHARLIPRKRQLVEEAAQLLKRQIDTVTNLMNAVEIDRSSALTSAIEKDSVDQALTTVILLMNTTIAENREKLRALEERYYITLQNQRADLDKEEFDNKQQKQEQERAIKNVEFRAGNLQETMVILPPSRLLRESPSGPGQIVGLFGTVGLFFGIFAAGFAEFAFNAKKYGKVHG